jgi:hypothetical protein
MATFISDTVLDNGREVDSLSAGQVTRLLDSLELHREMLQVGHVDAMRLTQEGLRPGYLLDFELIFRHMFRAEERPDWAQELQYLFSHEETTFLIGPGTKLEIDKFIKSVGFPLAADGTPEPRRPLLRRGRGREHGLDDATIKLGIYRLAELLTRPNVTLWEDIEGPDIDTEAFNTAKAALDARRGGHVSANLADAMNWAAVIYLRRKGKDMGLDYSPYLLTATKPLLNEKAWSSDVVGPVSRRPSDAIYIEVLLETFGDPSEAVDYTIRVAFDAATLERDLRLTPAYLNPAEHQEDPEFARAIEEDLVTDTLREQLARLTAFITDPVIARTQRIYDNASLATASVTQQRGEVLPVLTRSPRKLFDLIVEVNAALHAKGDRSALADLWDRALELKVELHESGRATYELLDRAADRRPLQYLVLERYPAEAPDPDVDTDEKWEDADQLQAVQFVLRWPSGLDAEDVLELFARSFARHNEDTVELTVGTDAGAEQFGANLPITVDELMRTIAEEPLLNKQDGVAQLRWLRMRCGDFDLYADVSPPSIASEPVIGVFVERLNLEHLQDLYERSCARYVFPAWLARALQAIAKDAG